MKPAKNTKILVVDDEPSIREFLEIMLLREGYKVKLAESGTEAIKLLAKESYDITITDIAMPNMSGIELLTKIKQQGYDTSVIMITAHGSSASAVEAMKLGATDYLTKPFEIEEMKICIQNALKTEELTKENRQLRSALGKTENVEGMIGSSTAMQEIFEMISQVAQTKTNTMILGESGTGKELVATAIHRNSAEKDKPLITINCAAIPEQLLESELFGHKRGAFTGAVADKKGLFQLADTGTLFLDEVGELPPAFQAKLLRAIQSKTFRAVGGTEDIHIDVRIICATNRNLEEEVKKGNFREDLFYRLNVIQIRLPALRERREDIVPIAKYFLSKFTKAMGKNIKTISKEALNLLEAYNYPGNVRELENIMERAVALEASTSIFPESLPLKLLKPDSQPIPAAVSPNQSPENTKNFSANFDLEKGVENFEREYIIRALEKSGGMKKKAAEILGISFRSLRYRITKYGIEDPNPSEDE